MIDLDELERLEREATRERSRPVKDDVYYDANGSARSHIGHAESALIAALRNAASELIADARLGQWARENMVMRFDGWTVTGYISGTPSLETIDEVLSAIAKDWRDVKSLEEFFDHATEPPKESAE